MHDGMFYLYGNLACNSVMTVSALWLLTDRNLSRMLRISNAFIAAGAVVNVSGMLADLMGYRNISYGHIWPGEMVGNFGTALLLGSWVWRSAKRRREERAGQPAKP